jgi:thioester reductase-like protein
MSMRMGMCVGSSSGGAMVMRVSMGRMVLGMAAVI